MARVVIVGGGAAGFMAAITAKAQNPTWEVSILEGSPRCLAKVLVSGGGRCNVTHRFTDVADFTSHYPRGQKALKGLYSRFSPLETQTWFQDHGVQLKTEPDGRLFPVTDSSETVVNALMQAARQHGVEIRTRCRVTTIVQEPSGQFVLTSDSGTQFADKVILTTGGSPYGLALAKMLGHTPTPCVPSLFTFKMDHPLLDDLQGVSVQHVTGTLKTPDAKPVTQSGPLLITHWGLSGPLVLRLSAWGAHALAKSNYQGQLMLDLLPSLSFPQVESALKVLQFDHPKKLVVSIGPEGIPKRLWVSLARHACILPDLPWGQLSPKAMGRLVETLKRLTLPIEGKGPFKEEFVTAGGVDLKEVDMRTMQSRVTPGVSFAGEILDVDGLTGGFNLQFAWSSGHVAALGLNAD